MEIITLLMSRSQITIFDIGFVFKDVYALLSGDLSQVDNRLLFNRLIVRHGFSSKLFVFAV